MADALRRVYVLPAAMASALKAEAQAAGEAEVVSARRLLQESLDHRETVEALAGRAARMTVQRGLAATLAEIAAHPKVVGIVKQRGGALISCAGGDAFDLKGA